MAMPAMATATAVAGHGHASHGQPWPWPAIVLKKKIRAARVKPFIRYHKQLFNRFVFKQKKISASRENFSFLVLIISY